LLAIATRAEHFPPVIGETASSSSPAEPSQAIAPTVLPLTEMGKATKQWSLTLYPAHLALAESSGERPYVILRDQVMKSATLIEGIRALALKEPLKATFKLDPEATSALAEWIGKPVLAGYYLRRRYGWVLPVAVIWIIGSMPLPGNAAAGVEAVRFDAIGFGLGLTLVASWAFGMWRPHPALFLVDSLWFLLLAGYLVRDVLQGRSKAWLALVAFAVWMVITGLKHFARFRGTSIKRFRA